MRRLAISVVLFGTLLATGCRDCWEPTPYYCQPASACQPCAPAANPCTPSAQVYSPQPYSAVGGTTYAQPAPLAAPAAPAPVAPARPALSPR